jgi:orotate phosphoribosyltransferase-like protein
MGTHQSAQVNPAATAEQQIRAYELKLAGKSFRAIGDELGFSHTWARELVEREIEARKWPIVEKWREVELARLEAMHQALWGLVVKHAQESDLAAVLAVMDRIERFGARRSKLLGLDAPVQVNATVHEVTQQDLELQQLIREAEAQAAAAEQAIKNAGAEPA